MTLKLSKNKKLYQLSADELLNQAFQFHARGNIEEAYIYYSVFLELGFYDPQALCNLAVILKNQGLFAKSLLLYKQVIRLSPRFHDAYLNLGNLYKKIGQLNQAEISTKIAIEIIPDNPITHLNLGLIYQDQDKLDRSELFLRKAILLQPDLMKARINLASIMFSKGNKSDSLLIFLDLIKKSVKEQNVYFLAVTILKQCDFANISLNNLRELVKLLLMREDISHQDLLPAINHLYSRQFLSDLADETNNSFSKDSFYTLIQDELLILAMGLIRFDSFHWEKAFRKIRKDICLTIDSKFDILQTSYLDFIIALAKQCFLNEYVFFCDEDESIALENLYLKCTPFEANELLIATISSYIPLFEIVKSKPFIVDKFSSKNSMKNLFKLQLFDLVYEKKLVNNIQKIGSINDITSQLVRSQYEENPYPRWMFSTLVLEDKYPLSLAINKEIKPNKIVAKSSQSKLRVLIAGCGTGQQVISAQRYDNAEITAIDLSLSSLAYAKRKALELGIKNVRFIHMDILDLHLLKTNFDVIESTGVLHHMRNPLQGLKALSNSLRSDGFIKLALYSEIARSEIVKMIDYVTRKNIMPTQKNIRSFRRDCFLGLFPEITDFYYISDFYSTSMCRDLCFHAMEHRYRISQINDFLRMNGLEFLGFVLDQKYKEMYNKTFPEDKLMINLKNWNIFEEKYKNTFMAMFQFWVKKIE